VGSDGKRNYELRGVLVLAVVACAIVGGLAYLIPEPPARGIGDAYQLQTRQHLGIVVRVESQHHFPDGTIREGWLLRAEDGFELWFPRDQMKKAELVRR
jgi:hypothetical protein